MVFSTQPNHSIWIAVHPLLLPGCTKHFFSSTGIHHDDRADIVTLEIFTKGYYILGFDLTPDREADEEHISLPRQGNMRIEARFKKPLPEPTTCILYAEFPGYVEIDNSRNVTVE